MRVLSLSLLLCLAAIGCGGGDDDDATDENIVLLDEASDEVVLTLKDLVDRGQATTDDEVAAHLTAPTDGEALPAGEAPTFTWTLRESNLRHGRSTGEFVWLHIEGPGMEAPIDVAAIESTSWTVDDERWQALQASTGPCEVQVVSAYIDRGIVTEGPFVPAANPTFSVTE